MNVFDLIKEKLQDETDCPNCSMYCADANICGFDEMCKQAISIVDEAAKEYEEKYITVPKDDFTEHLINMGYNKGLKDGYNKALDKFADKLKSGYKEIIGNNDCGTDCKPCLNEFLKDIDEIAEQLKGGM